MLLRNALVNLDRLLAEMGQIAVLGSVALQLTAIGEYEDISTELAARLDEQMPTAQSVAALDVSELELEILYSALTATHRTLDTILWKANEVALQNVVGDCAGMQREVMELRRKVEAVQRVARREP